MTPSQRPKNRFREIFWAELKISGYIQLFMLNLEKSVKLKSSTESKMSASAGIRTWDLLESSLLDTKSLPRLYKIE